MIDEWPNDEEMSERCACGCTLGQHHYGDERAACHECTCTGFHPVCSTDNGRRGTCFYRHPAPSEMPKSRHQEPMTRGSIGPDDGSLIQGNSLAEGCDLGQQALPPAG